MLPSDKEAARVVLGLPSSQWWAQRSTRKIIDWILRLHLPLPLPRISLPFSRNSGFGQFLESLCGIDSELASVGCLVGAAKPGGQNLLFLVFNGEGRPTMVAKTGIGPGASDLVAKEAALLSSFAPDFRNAPKLLSIFATDGISAFATSFFPGSNPPLDPEPKLFETLASWISQNRLVAVIETSQWRQLATRCSSDDLVCRVTSRLQTLRIHPAIYHGDCTPWNCRIAEQGDRWVFIDWTNGDLNGIPVWDALHYVTQVSLRIHHHDGKTLASVLDALLERGDFRRYAAASGAADYTSELMLGYLLFSKLILHADQEMPALNSALRVLEQRWLSQ